MHLRAVTGGALGAAAVVVLCVAMAAGLGLSTGGPDPEVRQRVEACRKIVLADVPRAKLMLLGTFHFQDAGLDTYKPKHTFDVFSEPGQAQIAEVLDRLAEFNPTKVAVEADATAQDRVDTRYAEFRSGTAKPSANEITQIGYTLAARLKHERVYAIDADPSEHLPEPDVQASAERLGQAALMQSPVMGRYFQAIGVLDELKTQAPLRTVLLVMNDPGLVTLGHGVYLTGSFQVGDGKDYAGADAFPTTWYNRNLRIFSNILRLAGPEERILVLIGAGHLGILRHAAECSPDVELVEVSSILGDR
jgi:hypothetical protein